MRIAALLLTFSLLVSCAPGADRASVPTAAEAAEFLARVDARLLDLGTALSRSGWVQQNFITQDTEALNARANQAFSEAVAQFAKEAVRFQNVQLPADQRRQLDPFASVS